MSRELQPRRWTGTAAAALRLAALLHRVHSLRACKVSGEEGVGDTAGERGARQCGELLVDDRLVPRDEGAVGRAPRHQPRRRRRPHDEQAEVDKVVIARAEQADVRAAEERGQRVSGESPVGIDEQRVEAARVQQQQLQQARLEHGRVPPAAEPPRARPLCCRPPARPPRKQHCHSSLVVGLLRERVRDAARQVRCGEMRGKTGADVQRGAGCIRV